MKMTIYVAVNFCIVFFLSLKSSGQDMSDADVKQLLSRQWQIVSVKQGSQPADLPADQRNQFLRFRDNGSLITITNGKKDFFRWKYDQEHHQLLRTFHAGEFDGWGNLKLLKLTADQLVFSDNNEGPETIFSFRYQPIEFAQNPETLDELLTNLSIPYDSLHKFLNTIVNVDTTGTQNGYTTIYYGGSVYNGFGLVEKNSHTVAFLKDALDRTVYQQLRKQLLQKGYHQTIDTTEKGKTLMGQEYSSRSEYYDNGTYQIEFYYVQEPEQFNNIRVRVYNLAYVKD